MAANVLTDAGPRPPVGRAAPLIRTEAVSVRFGGLQALDAVSLEVQHRSITGLIGPNGAGKTTLFNVLTGIQSVQQGDVYFEGARVTGEPTHVRARRGVARTFQKMEIFARMSVHDNLLVAWESAYARGVPGIRRSRPLREGRARVAEVVKLLDLEPVASQPAGSLATGTARVVEFGRALCTGPRIVLLDEPASGLDGAETEVFQNVLVDVCRRTDLTVLLVEHDVRLVMAICDLVHVMESGRLIATGTPQEVTRDEAVRSAYLGETLGGA